MTIKYEFEYFTDADRSITTTRTMTEPEARDYARSQGAAHARTIRPYEDNIVAIKATARKDWIDLYKYWRNGFDSELALWNLIRGKTA